MHLPNLKQYANISMINLIIIAFVFFLSDYSQSQTARPLDIDSDLIRVQVGDYPMVLPKAYLDAPIEPSDSALKAADGFIPADSIFLVTELPDLTPRSDFQAWLKHRGWKESRWVNLLLQTRLDDHIGPSDTNFRIFGRTWFPGAEIKDVGRRFGLELLAVDRTARDIFVRFENGVRTVLIVCSQFGSVPSPSCRQFIRVRPMLQANIIYGRQYLPQWSEIERKTRKLIEGFICNAEESSESKSENTTCPN